MVRRLARARGLGETLKPKNGGGRYGPPDGASGFGPRALPSRPWGLTSRCLMPRQSPVGVPLEDRFTVAFWSASGPVPVTVSV